MISNFVGIRSKSGNAPIPVASISPEPYSKLIVGSNIMANAGNDTGTSFLVIQRPSFKSIWGIVADAESGVLYIGDSSTIRKYVIATGQIETIAGSPISGYANGIGTLARLASSSGGIVKVGGALYFAENGDPAAGFTSGNCAIRKLDLSTLEVSTLAGPTPDDPPQSCGFQDGSSQTVRFRFRNRGSLLTSDGVFLYVADSDNHSIRRVSLVTGFTETIFGGIPPAPAFGSSNGTGGVFARFYYPYSIFYRSKNNTLIVGDGCNQSVRVLSLDTQLVTTPLKNGVGYVDGNSSTAKIGNCSMRGGALSADEDKMYMTDVANKSIRLVDLNSFSISTIVGAYPANSGVLLDGVSTEARIDGNGGSLGVIGNTIFFSNSQTLRNFEIPSLKVASITGNLPSDTGFLDGLGTEVRFSGVFGGTQLKSGEIYFTDNNAIRKLNLADAKVSTVAGPSPGNTPTAGFVDGPSPLLSSPKEIIWYGNKAYFFDMANCALRRFDPVLKVISTIAGSTPPVVSCGYLNGNGTVARFSQARYMTVLGDAIYISDSSNNAIRKVDLTTSNFSVTTIAGSSSGASGYADGVGGGSLFSFPRGIVAAADGFLYVADNGALRQVNTLSGAVVTVAGAKQSSIASESKDGIGLEARFINPTAIFADSEGRYIFILDGGSGYLRRYNIETKIVDTIISHTYGMALGGVDLGNSKLLLNFSLGMWELDISKILQSRLK